VPKILFIGLFILVSVILSHLGDPIKITEADTTEAGAATTIYLIPGFTGWAKWSFELLIPKLSSNARVFFVDYGNRYDINKASTMLTRHANCSKGRVIFISASIGHRLAKETMLKMQGMDYPKDTTAYAICPCPGVEFLRLSSLVKTIIPIVTTALRLFDGVFGWVFTIPIIPIENHQGHCSIRCLARQLIDATLPCTHPSFIGGTYAILSRHDRIVSRNVTDRAANRRGCKTTTLETGHFGVDPTDTAKFFNEVGSWLANDN